jgi:hypothetical protein
MLIGMQTRPFKNRVGSGVDLSEQPLNAIWEDSKNKNRTGTKLGRIWVSLRTESGKISENLYLCPGPRTKCGDTVMKTIFKLLGVTLVGLMAITGGAAAATGGFTVADTDAQTFNGNGAGDQVPTDNATLAQDGSNSPWVTGDERLDMFQDRFNLTDSEVQSIQVEVKTLIENDAAPEDIQSTVRSLLEDFGVEDPAVGQPVDGGQGEGPFGQGAGAGQGNGPADGTGNGAGQGAGNGPHGPADGSCMS